MWLDEFGNREFERGRSKVLEVLWLLSGNILVSSWIPGSWHRKLLLRVFGAKVGVGAVIKPHVRIKFPWRLEIGDYSWIGEYVWLDNLAPIEIGNHCCISQDAYLCTGSHDWSLETFDLITKPIRIRDKAWIAARAIVGPGVTVGEGAVLTLGGVATRDLEPWRVHKGNPAAVVRERPRNEFR